jgi:hypothetical protein
MRVSSFDFYCRACESPHPKETCRVFVRTTHLFVQSSAKEAFEEPRDSLNMVSMVEEDYFTQVYQVFNQNKSNQPKDFPLNFSQSSAC